MYHWIKCNSDGASLGNPGVSSCGGIFRDFEGTCLGCFVEPLGTLTSYQAEMCGALRAIEVAAENHWTNLWLETDSMLVVHTFRNSSLVPWQFRNRWNNVQVTLTCLNCIVTHIFREANHVGDSLANFGLYFESL